MSLLHAIQALIMGIVEGLTEFLPVSSTGHLILTGRLIGFDIPNVELFEVVIQLGAILAVCWLYRAKLLEILFNLRQRREQISVLRLIVAFIPAACIGLAFNHYIETVLFSPLVVATMLIVGAAAIWLVERLKPASVITSIDDISLRRAFLIGCAQAVSVIPGTSRSGATILGGLLLRLDRKVATEFSFFLAIPTMFAATLFDMVKHAGHVDREGFQLIAIGFVASFIFGLLAVKLFVNFVAKHDLVPFAIYRLLLGGVMLYIFTR